MIDESLIASLGVADDDAAGLLMQAFGEEVAGGDMEPLLGLAIAELRPGKIFDGKIVGVAGDDFVIDVGLKSEGLVAKSEFAEDATLRVGDTVKVLLESIEGDDGLIKLSKRKADRILAWERILETTKVGDIVEGPVTRKIKGGLLVDIGVPAFLPASQIDIRRPGDVSDFMGRKIRAEVLKIDEDRRNIVVSRRQIIERDRESAKLRLLERVSEGDLVKGTVKNIADFGAFIDLGGIDGLLHVTDMSWGRVNHQSELVRVGDEVEVKILNIDMDKEKIALGLKQKESSPWEEVEQRYPMGARVHGEVVSLVPYGAFVRLEDGVEGLVHVSEMSWTKRINHPSEVLTPGEEVDVVVLDIDTSKHEISLGVKQTEVNPWELVSEKYPPGTMIEGEVRNLTNYGAFVEIEPGIDGLLHVSDISWTRKVAHPNELIKKGDQVKCVVLEVDQNKQRISLGIKHLTQDPWLEAIPGAYRPGMVVRGKVTKITNFGVFVELEDDLEGLLHISELSDQKIEKPQEIVQVGDEIDVKILRVDVQDRKIGLSLKRAQWGSSEEGGEQATHESTSPAPTRGGMDEHGAMGTDKIQL